MPWAHDHARLSAEELALHVATHHAGCDDGDLPRGVHVHIDPLEAVFDSSQLPDAAPAGIDARWKVVDDALARGTVSLSCEAADPRVRDDARAGRCFVPSAGCDLFLKHGSLRI